MIRWFLDLLYGSVPAEFPSDFGLEESVKRLSNATLRWWSPAGVLQQFAMGTVSRDRVRLQRVIPFIRNSFKPFYVGRFERDGARTVLKGRFTIHWFTKVFVTAWLVLFLAGTVVAAFAPGGRNPWCFPLIFLAGFALAIGMIVLSKRFARNDSAWLSAVIRKALHR